MPTKIVLGLQHGDEGKGRVVDDLVQTWADVVVRFQGGGNAGHTVYDETGNKFVTHILPVGVLNKTKFNMIAKGCVVNIVDLYREIKSLNVKPDNLLVSGLCPTIEPVHLAKDRVKYQGKLGTTGRGIGPAYSDFYARDSVLFKDVINKPSESLPKIQEKFFDYQTYLAETYMVDKDEDIHSLIEKNFETFNNWIKEYYDAAEYLKPFLLKKENMIQDLYNKDLNILLEGAQGSGLCINSENYPDVTSSAPSVGEALSSTGLNHKQIDEVIGVIKSYKTKVGSGEFPSQIFSRYAETLAEVGKEYGATTGRPRKCGWLDLDEVKNAVAENGVTHLCVTKTDVMTHIEEPMYYVDKMFFKTPKINNVVIEDEGFKTLISNISIHTGVDNISFTTGPKRGEVVWYTEFINN